jgi:hypothetical protein
MPYEDEKHPMHGIVTDIRAESGRCVVAVAETADEHVEVAEAFLKDLVRHHRNKNRPEFKGVKSIEGDPAEMRVVVRCRGAKEPSAKVAKDVAEAVRTDFVKRDQELGRLMLPMKVRGGKVGVRVMGPDKNWEGLRSALEAYFKDRAAAGNRWAEAVTGVSVRTVKGPKVAVAVKFITVQEPPTFDTGDGHEVACYLFGARE